MEIEAENLNSSNEIKLEIEEGDTFEVIQQKTADYKQKVDENNAKLYARTKKAEGFELVEGKWVKTQKPEPKPEPVESQDLSQSDLIVLLRADVPEEDISEVTDYAKLKKISVAEALKSSVIKTLLSDKAEQRRSAEAANTGSNRRTAPSTTPEAILEKASTGELPDTDDGIQRLAEAHISAKKKANQK